MKDFYDEWDLVVGLEVHAQLMIPTKAFGKEQYEYGSSPNTQLSPVSLAHPGTLPTPNRPALDLALRMGIACGCNINEYSYYARKNYFYADLPKGYQITQYTKPMLTGGSVTIGKGARERKIALDKIILEEDSGKSIHDLDPFSSLIDLNRAGVALIEIVSQPELHTPEEAFQYLTELRQLVQYLDVCDGNMEEGSMRCDANVSIRPKGTTELRQRVEIKNLNSTRNLQRAIEFEMVRQAEIYAKGGSIDGETLGFDAASGRTYPMRSKELANDYRYFPEPDIPPVVVTFGTINRVREAMPQLPRAMANTLMTQYGLSEYDAEVITAEKDVALWFAKLIEKTKNAKAAANLLNGPFRSWMNSAGMGINQFPLSATTIAEIIDIIDAGRISISSATQRLIPYLIDSPQTSISDSIKALDLETISDQSEIASIAREIISRYPDKAKEYRDGRKNVLGLFMGDLMKATKGKADPKSASQILQDLLNQ